MRKIMTAAVGAGLALLLVWGAPGKALGKDLDDYSIPALKERVLGGDEERTERTPAPARKRDAGEPAEDKASYQRRIERRLDWLDGRIHQLKVDAANKGEESKAKLDRELPALERERREAARRLDQLEVSTGKAWQTLKADVDVAIGKLERTLNRVGEAI